MALRFDQIELAGTSSDDKPVLQASGHLIQVNTAHGYINIGADNSSYSHFYTDRAKYYFNKRIIVDEGIISSFNEDLHLKVNDDANTVMTLSKTAPYNVGIGNTTPQDKLDVTGVVNSSNNIVSNSTYTMFTGRSNRTVNDYGGLNKQYFKLNLVTPGPNTTGEASAHGFGDLRFQLANNAGSTSVADIMTLRSNGNVGIGTTTPENKLSVAGNIGLTGNIVNYDRNDTTYPIIHINDASTASDTNGDVIVSGYYPIIFKTDLGHQRAKISRQGDFQFYTGTGGVVGMHWDNADAKLGIGTTGPGSPLHVAASGLDVSDGALGVHIGVHASTYAGIEMVSTGNNSSWIDFLSVGSGGDYKERIRGGAGLFEFHTNGNERVRIDSSGNVGIGTTNPGAKLEVSGTGLFTDFLKANKLEFQSGNWRKEYFVRSVGVTGADIGGVWVHLLTISNSSTYAKFKAKFRIDGYDDVTIGEEKIDVIYENGSATQENHSMYWYYGDNLPSAFSAVKSIRTSSSGLSNTYQLWVQMAGDWRDTFTVEVEYFSSHNTAPTFPTSTGQVSEPSGDNDVSRTSRNPMGNADLLDGQHGSYYATASHNHDSDYVNVTGDTMTGVLYLGNVASDQKIQFQRTGGNVYSIEHDSSQLYFYNRTTTESPIIIKNDGNVLMNAGNVGIGTTSPSHKLHIEGGVLKVQGDNSTDGTAIFVANSAKGTNQSHIHYGTTGDWYIRSSSTSGKVILQDSGGNVGIGTTSPSAAMHIQSSATKLLLSNTDFNPSTSTGSGLLLQTGASSGNTYGMIYAFQSGNTAYANLIVPGGNVGIGTTSPFTTGGTAKLTIATDSPYADSAISWGASNTDMSYFRRIGAGQFQWQTYNSGNTGEIHLQPYGGNVGIGTTSPQDKLHIVGAVRGDLKIEGGYSSGTTDVGKLTFGYTPRGGDTNNKNIAFISAYNTTTDSTSGGYLSIGTRATNGSLSEGIRITNSGNVGIGETNPGTKLDVAGTSRSDLHIFRSNQSAPTADAFIFRPADNTVALGTASTERMRITSGGNILMGTTSTTRFLTVAPSTGAVVAAFMSNSATGGIELQSSTTTASGWVRVEARGDNLDLVAGLNSSASLLSTGQLKLNQYSSVAGGFSGTPYKMLAVDSSGNVISENVPKTLDRCSFMPSFKSPTAQTNYLVWINGSYQAATGPEIYKTALYNGSIDVVKVISDVTVSGVYIDVYETGAPTTPIWSSGSTSLTANTVTSFSPSGATFSANDQLYITFAIPTSATVIYRLDFGLSYD